MAGPQTADDESEREADRAASQGDLNGAQTLLERLTTSAPDRVQPWLKLAAVRRASGDLPGAMQAISGALRADPLDLMALLSRARLLEAAGKPDEAARDYVRALAQCEDGSDEALPAAIAPLIEHARQRKAAYQSRISETWRRAIGAGPALSERERARLDRFASNALRETRVYHCEPTHYHYPGLVEREVHDRDDFPWLADLEAATASITEEFTALASERGSRAEPYVQYAIDAPVRQWSALNNSLDWTAFHLTRGGSVISGNAERCPRTMAVLARIPQPRIAGRSPNAMFSMLRPRTRIPPHTGIANTRLVCHLPLIVPQGCWFRVGATRREWRVGEAFLFDDTIEHEAANDSDEPRIVLIIDAWHPGLSDAERAAVVRVMEAEEAEYGAPI